MKQRIRRWHPGKIAPLWLFAWLVLTVTVPAAAQASRWRPIFTEAAYVADVDTTRMVATQNAGRPVLQVWIRWTFKEPQAADSGKTYVSAMTQDQVQCKPLAGLTSYFAMYSKEGTVVKSRDMRDMTSLLTLKEPAPETRGEGVYTAVCRWFGYLINQ